MNLDNLILKVLILEGLSVALDTLLDYDVQVVPECRESFNAVSSLADVLKEKVIEIRKEIDKYV